MTFKLVGAMSFVLLVTLASFAILMSRHHDMVMDELSRTIADVGKLTLRSFQLPQDPGGAALHKVVIKKEVRSGTGAADGANDEERVVIVSGSGARDARTGDALDLEEVHVESGPGKGLVLHLPILEKQPAPGQPGQGDRGPGGGTRTMAFTMETTTSDAGEVDAKDVLVKDIALPVPTREYDDLFAKTRRESLYLFLGALLFGTLLTALLSARFTRPIRQLDAALHRMSEGRLDVEVPVRGKDEIGRLGRAFNEMVAKLRSSRDREREITRQEKLSALGRLAAGVAHDVRNPLHAIGLTLQNIQDLGQPASGSKAEFDRSIAVIREEIGRLDRLVENFLRFARSDRRPRASVDVAALLAETAALVEKEAMRRNVKVTVASPPDLPAVQADPESMRSAILNLVVNSFDAMPDGGSLTLSARHVENAVVVDVADTGKGIVESERERVFEFAYTTREGGSGLGLAMVHQVVVEDHGGRVTLESTPGSGTQVRLSLPLGAAPLPA
ncbi:MAG: ATP-binding protein [Acidobacteriota bacterium]